MSINKTHKFAFIHIPKTGGCSIKQILKHYEDDSTVPIYHRTVSKVIWKYGYTKDYYKFSFVRNPWDRFVSAFMYLRGGGQRKQKGDRIAQQDILKNGEGDMKKFLNSGFDFKKHIRHMNPQVDFLLRKGKNVMDYIGRYETLSEDFDKVCNHLNIDLWSLPTANRTSGKAEKEYIEYFDKETEEIIGEAYRDDIEMLGYKFGDSLVMDNWRNIGCGWPQKRERAGLDLIKEGAVCLEAGAWKGHLSERILLRNPSELHLVDLWAGDEQDWSTWGRRPKNHFVNQGMEKIYEGVKGLFKDDNRVTIHRTHSRGVSFPKEYFDWVYIDADHAYESVLADLEFYYPLVKRGGVICGDDYNWTEEVGRAVDEFAKKMKLKVVTSEIRTGPNRDKPDQWALEIK